MEWKDVVVVVAASIAAVATLVVPYLTYRFAVNQEHRKWLRERRLETYINVISEMQLSHRVLDAAMKGKSATDELSKILMSNEQLTRVQLFVSGNALKLVIPWMHGSGEIYKAAAKATPDDFNDPEACKSFVEYQSATDEMMWRLIATVRSELGSDGVPLPKRELKRLRRILRS